MAFGISYLGFPVLIRILSRYGNISANAQISNMGEAVVHHPVDESLFLGEKLSGVLTLSNFTSATKTLITLTTLSISYFARLYRIFFQPIFYLFQLFWASFSFVLNPLFIVFAPIQLALQVMLAPVILPVLKVYRLIKLLYSLYVLVGAATVCGALKWKLKGHNPENLFLSRYGKLEDVYILVSITLLINVYFYISWI
ncbi:hypothetical protein PNOK_0841900 [Pyrrhoderma noxium]|uniref:Uncharacterized protein n=1 Tax=Pyrrhoderma noxium TaxID=2282107 RepID=A0A286U7J9_9AGAM|nr:hypothetical protein PNOK_0841900 [Pyrrhoderma noxium]